MEKMLREMREQRVIEDFSGPLVSPAVIVKKKDGSLKFCVGYRKLNAVTKKDSYPLPRVDDLLDQLSDNMWFSTLDMKSGYWQVKIRKKERGNCLLGRERIVAVHSDAFWMQCSGYL